MIKIMWFDTLHLKSLPLILTFEAALLSRWTGTSWLWIRFAGLIFHALDTLPMWVPLPLLPWQQKSIRPEGNIPWPCFLFNSKEAVIIIRSIIQWFDQMSNWKWSGMICNTQSTENTDLNTKIKTVTSPWSRFLIYFKSKFIPIPTFSFVRTQLDWAMAICHSSRFNRRRIFFVRKPWILLLLFCNPCTQRNNTTKLFFNS